MREVWRQISNSVATPFSDITDIAEVTRLTVCLLIAAILGGVLGFDREAGQRCVRTHAHAGRDGASAIFMVIRPQIGVQPSELTRVVHGMVTGIRLVGADAILKRTTQAAGND